MLIVETHVRHEEIAMPVMEYLPRVATNLTSNYWRPNSNLICLLLKEMGFQNIVHCVRPEPPDGLEIHGYFQAFR